MGTQARSLAETAEHSQLLNTWHLEQFDCSTGRPRGSVVCSPAELPVGALRSYYVKPSRNCTENQPALRNQHTHQMEIRHPIDSNVLELSHRHLLLPLSVIIGTFCDAHTHTCVLEKFEAQRPTADHSDSLHSATWIAHTTHYPLSTVQLVYTIVHVRLRILPAHSRASHLLLYLPHPSVLGLRRQEVHRRAHG